MAENPIYEPPPKTMGSETQSTAGHLANRGKAARDALARQADLQAKASDKKDAEGLGELGGIIAALAALVSQQYAAIPAAYGAGKMGTEALVAGVQGDPKTALNKGVGAASSAQSIYAKQQA